MHLWLVVIMGIAGGLAGHYLAQLRHRRGAFTTTAYGAAAGVVVGLVLPVLLDLVGLLFQLVFTLGVILAVVLAGAVVWRIARR